VIFFWGGIYERESVPTSPCKIELLRKEKLQLSLARSQKFIMNMNKRGTSWLGWKASILRASYGGIKK
jgi:hypothetical protein